MIRKAQPADWNRVKEIYSSCINNGTITFESVSQMPESSTEWIESKVLFLVLEWHEQLVGWATLSTVSNRCALSGVVESSLYIDPAHHKKGHGTLLMQALIDFTEANGIWTIEAQMLEKNQGSLQAHLHYGFRKVGVRERFGKLKEAWQNVILLERRSAL